MKTLGVIFIIFLMIIQAVLFHTGIIDLSNGKIGMGLFLISINLIFFIINIYNLNSILKIK